MSESKRFELCFRLPVTPEGVPTDRLAATSVDASHARSVEYVMIGGVKDVTRDIQNLVYHTRVRAFDVKSYFLCRYLVKEKAFGFINQKRFFFLDLNTGDEHELKSKAVQEALKASEKFVGSCFRVRSTIRT